MLVAMHYKNNRKIIQCQHSGCHLEVSDQRFCLIALKTRTLRGYVNLEVTRPN